MLRQLFENKETISKIQNKLPFIFQIAEVDSSRAGKIGMEVGSLRERILIALLVHEFGEENIETEIPITASEIDVLVSGNPVSIKTITSTRIIGVKLIWTVDQENAVEFVNSYNPVCDVLLAHINWGGQGGLHLIPRQSQQNLLDNIGRNEYFRLPRLGTNPRGVELSTPAARQLVQDPSTLTIPITWKKQEIDYNPYERWLDYWNEEN